MPHDSRGQIVKKGDTVVIEFVVKNVWATETACNVELEAIDRNDTGECKPIVSCNARLVTGADSEE